MQKNNVAFVFPGQGSQSVGMLSDIALEFPKIKENFQIASDILGYDLWTLVQQGPKEMLDATINTQLAMLLSDISLFQLWISRGGYVPAVMSGHSLGEYAALVSAEAIDLSDAVRLVFHRSELMQNAVPAGEGAMAAILGLADEDVVRICEEVQSEGRVEPANFNSPGQVVIGGQINAVKKAMEIAKEKGAIKVVQLAMSVPSHCSLMRDAAKQLAEVLEGISIQSPKIPVIHNADMLIHADKEMIKQALVAQLYSPVRWADIIRKMMTMGVDTIIECGPGKTLSGLNKRIDKDLKLFQLNSLSSVNELINKG